MSLFGEYVVTPKNLKAAEEKLMDSGITEDELIARAAAALKKSAEKSLRGKDDKILFVTGGGNNGCDGLECARLFWEEGFDVSVFPVGVRRNDGNEKRLAALKAAGVPFVNEVSKNVYRTVVDCVFGIGLTRAPEKEYLRAISEINLSRAVVISADVPSGLDADSGKAYGACVTANETVTFTAVKTGLILGEGRNYTGDVTVAEIGIPCVKEGRILSDEDAVLPPRKPASHKGSFGKVRVIGGSMTMPGAPLMCFESAVAALRTGAGLVTLCVPKSEKAAFESRVKENMLYFLPSENGKILFDAKALDEVMDGADSIAIGCGMGKDGDTAAIVKYLAQNFSGTLVLDADALNAVSRDKSVIKGHKCKLILTPHVVEYARLNPDCGLNYLEGIRCFAREYNCVVAVKSATTVITDGSETYFSMTGGPMLSKGGSGDVLSGMIAALSCVLPQFQAVKAGCFHFGKAGERAAKRLNSVTSVLASDVIIEIAYAR